MTSKNFLLNYLMEKYWKTEKETYFGINFVQILNKKKIARKFFMTLG